MAGLITMVLSVPSLGIALMGGAKLVFDILEVGFDKAAQDLPSLVVKLVALGIALGVGWAMGALSVRVFDNRIMPQVVYIYCWVTLAAVCAIYGRIIYRFYAQNYDQVRYFGYMAILFSAVVVLVVLHFILKNHDLRFYAVPILMTSLAHMFVIVFHYVFMSSDIRYFTYELITFGSMFFTGILMLAHIGIFNPARNWMDRAFEIERE